MKGNNIDPEAYATGFTDLIVQAKNNGSYVYPNLQTCLEASRGNLENQAMFERSKGGKKFKTNPNLSGVAPQNGYYINYWSQVLQTEQPIADAKAALINFVDSVNKSADVHFGLEAFSDTVGESADDYWKVTPCKIDTFYKYGGNDRYPIPLVNLDQDASKCSDLIQVFQSTDIGNISGNADGHRLTIVPAGKTNIADSLRVAVKQLTDKNKSRSFAKKAIVLFTDGVANEPFDIYSANSSAMKEAEKACQNGIPIFTIGLSQNTDIAPLEDKLLGDGHHGSGQGIAYASGNRAVYIPVRTTKDLQAAFQTIARSLVVLRPNK